MCLGVHQEASLPKQYLHCPSCCAAIPWCLTHTSAGMQVLKSLGELLDDVELVFMREHLRFVTWELRNSWPERNKGISA